MTVPHSSSSHAHRVLCGQHGEAAGLSAGTCVVKIILFSGRLAVEIENIYFVFMCVFLEKGRVF